MMSTQPSFAPYGYNYGISPGGKNRNPRKKRPPAMVHQGAQGELTPPSAMRKVVAPVETLRESPATVETTAESDSLS